MADDKKQTNLRLEPEYDRLLEEAAKQAGMKKATLARQMVLDALGGGSLGQVGERALPAVSGAADSALVGEVLERVDSVERNVRRLERTLHVTLRTLVGTLLPDAHEAENARRTLDEYLGPMPSRVPE